MSSVNDARWLYYELYPVVDTGVMVYCLLCQEKSDEIRILATAVSWADEHNLKCPSS